jgi:hypothetical protein
MARFAAGVKTSAGTVQWPILSLFSSATNQVEVREIGVFNTTTTGFDVRLARIASGPGTVGAGLTETCLDNPSMVAGGMAFTTYTAGTPTLTDLGYRASIGAAIGSGVIWTFGGEGVEVIAASGTTTGICVAIENGAGQAAQAYIVWDE